MYIVSVLPITKNFGLEELSYFSANEYESGMVVKVPLRKKDVWALVIESTPAEKARMELRASNFSLKKIKGNSGKIVVSQAFMRAAQKFSEYEAQSFSSVLSVLLPSILFEVKRQVTPPEPKCTLAGDISVFQGDTVERYSAYKSLIRETFARKKSFFLLVPTAEDARSAEKELSRGIEQFTATVYGGKNKKELNKLLKTIDDGGHPVLIIATPPFLSLIRNDTEILAIDREGSRSFRTFSRPNIDWRIFAKMLAHEYCTRVLLGSEILSVETMQKVRNGGYHEWGHLKMREISEGECSIISMTKEESSEPFKILSPELEKIIQELPETGKKVFLFTARRGLSPTTVCADCETLVTCKTCDAPLVLYGNLEGDQASKKEPYFLCHKCGERLKAKDQCSHCGGWRLIALGIGTEQVEKELKRISPHLKVFRLDKETASTPLKAQKIVEEFLSTTPSVLLGTEMALHFLRKPVEISAVVSADSILGVPDFRINEKMMSLLIYIKSLGTEKTFFQTRNPENSIFECAKEGNLLNFFERELNERKKFAFPPFSLFIKIIWEGTPTRAEKDSEIIKETFGEEVQIIKVRGGARLVKYHALIKIEPKTDDEIVWPETALVKKLLSLAPQFSVFVDPDALL